MRCRLTVADNDSDALEENKNSLQNKQLPNTIKVEETFRKQFVMCMFGNFLITHCTIGYT